MDKIKQHFEEEARDFDRIIQTLIPDYLRMVEALVAAIPFESAASVRAIDLGCGTGIIAELGAVGLETTSRIGGFIQGPPVDSGGRAAASAFVSDNPGTWSVSTTTTPEPATLLLFGSTIDVLVGVYWSVYWE